MSLADSLFMQLPDELQIKILGELPVQDLLKATMVCHKWEILAYDGSLWTTIDVTPFYKTIPIDTILKLIKCSSRFLKTANFRGCIQLTGHGLRTLSEYCPNLEVLIIKDCRGLSAASISHFLQRANQLRVLDVSGLDTVKSSTRMSVTNPSLNKLEKLNMSWCKNITGPGIISVISASNSLCYLKLNGCPQLDDTTMASLGNILQNLSHLCLIACTSLTDTSILAFLKNHSASASALTHLNLSSCTRLTDTTLRNLAIYAPNITHLELAGCVLMTDQGFNFLSPRLKKLIHLDLEDIQNITDVTVRSIANHQPHLVRFCLSNCTQISDDAITHLVFTCHKLQRLELDNCTITDAALNTIALYLQKHHQEQHNKRLSDITTSSSVESSVSFFSSSSLSQQQQMERKMSVDVLDCSNITENGVREALAKAKSLLIIKSFYSFLNVDDDQQTIQHDEESIAATAAVDNIHRHHRGTSSRYNVIGARNRRRTGGHVATGQDNNSANCIIL